VGFVGFGGQKRWDFRAKNFLYRIDKNCILPFSGFTATSEVRIKGYYLIFRDLVRFAFMD
jgi:hypothetical protein